MDVDKCRCNVRIVKPKVEAHKHGKCPTKSYPYQSLASPTSIRLLKLDLLPGSSHNCEEDIFSSKLEASLITVDLANNPPYTALSYTWGDPKIYYSSQKEIFSQADWYCQCYTIEIDDHEVTISANLYTALVSIRYVKSVPRYSEPVLHSTIQRDSEYLWVDALCINQVDLAEKSSQVQLMGQIYSQSLHVFVWLGGADSTSVTAFNLLRMLTDICMPNRTEDGRYPAFGLLQELALDDPRFYETLGITPHIPVSIWSDLFAFLNRSWYRRAWVVQEMGLASNAVILCGLDLFNDNQLHRWTLFLDELQILSKLEDLEPLLVDGHQLSEQDLQCRALWSDVPDSYSLYKSQEVNGWNSIMILCLKYIQDKQKMMRRTSSDHDREGETVLPPISLTTMLFRSTEASDPRDKIYAFLGISNGGTLPIPKSIAPDYSRSPQQVYLEWAEFMIPSDTYLCLLSMVEDPSLRKMDGLPSWVPDFTTEGSPKPFRMPAPLPFYAGRGLGPMHAAFPESGVLEVRGYKLNKISAAARSNDLERGGIKAIAKFLSALPRVVLIKKPGTAFHPDTTVLNINDFVHQSRLDVYWRTLITDRFREEYPAPESCGQAMKISFRRCLSQSAGEFIRDIKSRDDYDRGWQEYLHENLAWESLLLPGEMIPIHEQLARPISTPTENQTSEGRPVDHNYNLVMLDGGDFGSKMPSEWLDGGSHLPWDEGLEAEYMYRKKICQKMRKLVIISPGGLGLAPDSVAIDDEVWILAGSQVPFILRPVGENRYRLIGEAYVHGLMHGEGMEGIDVSWLGIRNILLV